MTEKNSMLQQDAKETVNHVSAYISVHLSNKDEYENSTVFFSCFPLKISKHPNLLQANRAG